MTAELVRRHTEFPSLEDYLHGYAITGCAAGGSEGAVAHHHLAATTRSSRQPGSAQLAQPPGLSLTVTRYGGHCGFFEHLSGPTWLERRILTCWELGPSAGGAGDGELSAPQRTLSARAFPRTARSARHW